jgi:5'-3' exonuclease
MGIPSYYKKLVDCVPGLITKSRPNDIIDWLYMDYNCLIYHCLNKPDCPNYLEYISSDCVNGKDEWEKVFLDFVVKYTLKVIKEVNPSMGVFIAIDGVVPMAKMKQQRQRRFKSSYMAKYATEEPKEENGAGRGGNGWDKNAITPGTEFMEKLNKRLNKMAIDNNKYKYIISSSEEFGEGEHKIMSMWRSRLGLKEMNYVVYGLDADLIVLSLLNSSLSECKYINNIWLFREINEDGASFDSVGNEFYQWFSINILRSYLILEFFGNYDIYNSELFILNYCFAMSVLGNDFLPSSLSFKMKDDGHTELVKILSKMINNEQYIIDDLNRPNIVNFDALKVLFSELESNEYFRITRYITNKCRIAETYLQKSFGCADISESEKTACMMFKVGDNNWPLSELPEKSLIKEVVDISGQNKYKLISDWKREYFNLSFGPELEFSKRDISLVCSEYLYGIQWIWAYYLGRYNDICCNWYYNYSMPPLWCFITNYLDKNTLPEFPSKIQIKCSEIKPAEQLALVLPQQSWNLIRDPSAKKMIDMAPYLFPNNFTFHSLGKRYFWECEAVIPIPSILDIKQILSSCRFLLK